MKRWIAVLRVAGLAGATNTFAQERWPGAGTVAVTIIPAGGTFFTEGKDAKEPSFGNYGIGGLTLFDQASLDIPDCGQRGHGGVLTNVGR